MVQHACIQLTNYSYGSIQPAGHQGRQPIIPVVNIPCKRFLIEVWCYAYSVHNTLLTSSFKTTISTLLFGHAIFISTRFLKKYSPIRGLLCRALSWGVLGDPKAYPANHQGGKLRGATINLYGHLQCLRACES